MEYTEHPMESLTAEELEKVAAYEHPFTDDNVKNISMRFQSKIEVTKRKKHPTKRLTFILVAAAAVALMGFTNIDRIQQLFGDYFGTGINFSQYAQTIDKSCIDQGISMEVLTALNDGDNTYLFVDLKDETGNRLSEDLFVDNWDLQGGRSIGGGNCRLVRYNSDTGVATLSVHAIGGRPGKEAVFSLDSFFTDEVEFDFTDDTIQLDQLLSEQEGKFVKRDLSRGTGGGYAQEFRDAGLDLHDITDVLASDATHVDIPGYDKGYLSNIGHKDGFLHIQVNPNNEKGNEAVMLSLVNKQTGEELQSFYTILYGEYTVDNFTISGDYIESVFQIDRTDLKNYELHLYGWYYNNVVTGNWEVNFEVPAQMTTAQVPANKTIALGGENCTVKALSVSPLSISMTLEGGAIKGDIEVTLVYKDGSEIILEEKLQTQFKDEGTNNLQINGPIMTFENLAAVKINGVEFKLLHS